MNPCRLGGIVGSAGYGATTRLYRSRLTLAVPSQTAPEAMCYKFVWCFQDGRVHPVLPDCPGDAMLSLRPDNLQPLTKGILPGLDAARRSQAQLSS